jgi:hypothetical protein
MERTQDKILESRSVTIAEIAAKLGISVAHL